MAGASGTGEDGPGASGPPRGPEEAAAISGYRARLAATLAQGTSFWERVGREELVWRTPFTQTLDWQPPFARWYPDGRLNAAENCLDRHLATEAGRRIAYLWEGEDGSRRTLTYEELARAVNRLASALDAEGFGPDDFAAIYLPMVPELPIAMLALARLGIPFTTVFSGFSAAALSDRIRDLGARLLITADGGWRRGKIVPLRAIAEEALATAPTVTRSVVVRRTGERVDLNPARDVGWDELLRRGDEEFAAPAFPSDHLLYLLYSSGTTGVPKAIAHGTGGYLAHVRATMRWVFDVQPHEVFWCAADIGWVTGHSYIVFGPLANGLTSVLYEGAFDHPSPSRMWEIVERYRVNVLHTSPTALRALRKHGDEHVRHHDLSSLRMLGTVGEAINPEVWRWYHEIVGGGRCPIVDTWWQTETGGMLVSAAPGLASIPMKPGSATLPLPGIDADVVNEKGEPTKPGEKGFAIVRRPWPGMLLTLHKDPERYRRSYWERFPGCYYAGDFALRDADGYFWFLGRADEVLKVAAHRLGTIEIESALLTHPAVAEAAVCGVPDEEKGEVPVAFVVLRGSGSPSPQLAAELRRAVDARIGKIARPRRIYFVRSLPKTRSGKIMRRVVRAVATGQEDVGDLTTLDDEASVDEVRAALESLRDAETVVD
ncbi:MAG: acetate--CoA ligase [Thermoplasmata archaeon]|nr:acetate--CoA ligase [Thermoplasmata archaeon]